jgi:hypothetical protein
LRGSVSSSISLGVGGKRSMWSRRTLVTKVGSSFVRLLVLVFGGARKVGVRKGLRDAVARAFHGSRSRYGLAQRQVLRQLASRNPQLRNRSVLIGTDGTATRTATKLSFVDGHPGVLSRAANLNSRGNPAFRRSSSTRWSHLLLVDLFAQSGVWPWFHIADVLVGWWNLDHHCTITH